jgi:hypothetical protein
MACLLSRSQDLVQKKGKQALLPFLVSGLLTHLSRLACERCFIGYEESVAAFTTQGAKILPMLASPLLGLAVDRWGGRFILMVSALLASPSRNTLVFDSSYLGSPSHRLPLLSSGSSRWPRSSTPTYVLSLRFVEWLRSLTFALSRPYQVHPLLPVIIGSCASVINVYVLHHRPLQNRFE